MDVCPLSCGRSYVRTYVVEILVPLCSIHTPFSDIALSLLVRWSLIHMHTYVSTYCIYALYRFASCLCTFFITDFVCWLCVQSAGCGFSLYDEVVSYS